MKMSQSQYEKQYITNLRNILNNGAEDLNTRTGKITRRLPATAITVDLEKELPILLSKKVNWKVAVDEVFWIFQKQSNNVNDLNSRIWDSWADEEGSIGTTYGYQVGRVVHAKRGKYLGYFTSQVHYVLETLAEDPSSRQAVIDMWDPWDLAEMALPPCVYSSVWSIIEGRLNCMVVQRSCDYPVGVPFDTFEYAVLTHLFARHLGVRPGILTHAMADSHIYVDQLVGVKTQIARFDADWADFAKPGLCFREDAPTNFWEVKPGDLMVRDYGPMDPIKFNVAV